MYSSKYVQQEIQEYAKTLKNVVYIIEGIGCKDVEIEVQVKDSNMLYELIDMIRDKFENKIRKYEFLEYSNEEKFKYLQQ